jgi:Dual specificity phosphatase, catalytic domain
MRQKLRRYWPVMATIAIACAVIAANHVADRLAPPAETYPYTNYALIEDGLYLGGILAEPPPGTRAVLNVCETKDPYRAEVHRWEPIPDAAPAPSIAWLRQQVEFIDEQRRAGRPTFIHCRAGVSRSAMVAAAYLMWRDGCSRDEALEAIRVKRPRIGPNPAFLGLLLEWEDSLKKSKG